MSEIVWSKRWVVKDMSPEDCFESRSDARATFFGGFVFDQWNSDDITRAVLFKSYKEAEEARAEIFRRFYSVNEGLFVNEEEARKHFNWQVCELRLVVVPCVSEGSTPAV